MNIWGIYKLNKIIVSLILVFTLSSCAEVPKEVPELSMTVGVDIAAMQSSHRQIVRALFKELRQQRENYLQYEWTPEFIKTMIVDGKLREIAAGDTVWNEIKEDFEDPIPGKEENQLLTSINAWSTATIEEIQSKRNDLMKPLDDEEVNLLAAIDDGYSNMLAANAQITGFLTSLRNVEEMQDGFLDKLGMTGIRQTVNNRLVQVSEWASTSLEDVREADNKFFGNEGNEL